MIRGSTEPSPIHSGSFQLEVWQEVSAGIVLDFNDRSQVVGIEVLDVKKRFPNADPKTIRLEMA